MEGQVRKGGGGRTDGWVEGQEALGGKVENTSVMEWTEKTGQIVSGRMAGEAHNIKMSWYTGLSCSLLKICSLD